MIIKVQVTQDHINKGCRNDGGNCPVFLAMRDASIPVTWAFLTHWSMDALGPHTPWEKCHMFPGEAVQFIGDFDSRNGRAKAKPFEFELDVELNSEFYANFV